MNIRGGRKFGVAATLGLAVLALPACGGGPVDVTLREFEVVPADDSASAGSVTFSVANEGAETHEFVVIKTDLAPDALPTAEDGSVDEEGEGIEVIGEIEDIAAGDTQETTLDLDAGGYALICNVVEEEDGQVVSHYQEGMHSEFTIE